MRSKFWSVGEDYKRELGKSGQGDQGWHDFFRLASAAITHFENGVVVAVHAEQSFETISPTLFGIAINSLLHCSLRI